MVLLPVPLISLILCMRLVTKKAILLIDDIERLRLGGKNRSAALIEAGRIRHRPMVRRTRAVIFRMVPLTLCGFHVVAQLRLGFVLARQTLA
jgi:HAE1 family hydrophobic/amphiphilic exporter-1